MVLSLIEKTSGGQVVVSEDRSFKTLAATRIARGVNKIHAISYNPSAVGDPDRLGSIRLRLQPGVRAILLN